MQRLSSIPRQIAGVYILKIVLAVTFLTLSAKLTVPFYPVPMTMQVAAVLLIAGLGGLRFGVTSLMSYLAAGAAGLPVFAGTSDKGIGFAYMLGPTGGYLVGFLVAAALVGWAVDRFGKKAVWVVMPMGLAVIYGFGLAWLRQFVPARELLSLGLTPFFLGDCLKVLIAAVLSYAASNRLRSWVKT